MAAEPGPEALVAAGGTADADQELTDALADDAEPELGDEVELDDIEAEVAELLGEAPPSRAALEFDHSRLFQEAPGQASAADEPDPDEQDPLTN